MARPRRTGRRRRLLPLALVILAAGVVGMLDRLGVFGSAEGDFGRYHGRSFLVSRVVDGDTFDLLEPDPVADRQETRIRLWGVDTPETVHPDRPPQHFGPEASRRARELLSDRRVRLELLPGQTRGQHGRLLAYVYLPDGRMLNRLLVEEGMGFADPRFEHPYRVEFDRLMQQSRRGQRGLWARARAEDLPYYLRDSAESP